MRGPARTALLLVGVPLVMGALTFAAVPMYSWFCRTTGFAGTTLRAETAPGEVLDRTVTVRFDANTEAGMPWHFRARQTSMTLRIGETGLAFFEATNPTDRPTAGQASYNVAPDRDGAYFTKIACFCFDMQVLGPGETAEMPVTFFVDPDIVKDAEARGDRVITLSYTFHSAPVPDDYAAAIPAKALR